MRGFRKSDDIFREFEKMFREIEHRMHEMMKEMFSPETWNIRPEDLEKLESNPNVKTYYWGYRAEIGPDGVPRIETWGNVPPPMLPMSEIDETTEVTDALPEKTSTRPRLTSEPITDLIEDDQDETVRVIMELPGVTERDVKIEVSETSLKVEANTEFKRFYKEVTFPHAIDPKSMKKTLKNGILELQFKFKNGNEPKRRFRIRLP